MKISCANQFGCEKLGTLLAWPEPKVKSKQEVIKQVQKDGKTVHFATLMDFRHLTNSELDKKFKKYTDYVETFRKMTPARMEYSPSRDLYRRQ